MSEFCMSEKRLYRSRRGMILGVCRGLAEYFDVPAFWVRVAAVGILILTGFFPIVVIYFVAALLMKPEPAVAFESASDEEFYATYTASRPLATGRLRRTYDTLDRRLQRLESIVTSRDFEWDARLNRE